MAKSKTFPKLFITFFIIPLLFSSSSISAAKNHFHRILSPSSLGLHKEKLSHLRFYFHDNLTGPKPSGVIVAEAPTTNTSATGFGAVTVFDNTLTLLPELSSQHVGKAQGIYAQASLEERGALSMVINFVFVEGKFNGSSISVVGRNRALTAVREMPVVGGSGVFRFARGYTQARTHSFDNKTGNAVVEYDVYVFHY